MTKIDITRTELVWPGKYNEDGTLKEVPRVSLPFQVIETVNESRATREGKRRGVQGTLFDVYEGKEGDTFEAGWRNKLIWGDNLLVMGSLLEKFAGKIDLIYIDPPFATGADFSFTAAIGESGDEVLKEQSIIEEKAYRDTWGIRAAFVRDDDSRAHCSCSRSSQRQGSDLCSLRLAREPCHSLGSRRSLWARELSQCDHLELPKVRTVWRLLPTQSR